jgi:hypothetical protein
MIQAAIWWGAALGALTVVSAAALAGAFIAAVEIADRR